MSGLAELQSLFDELKPMLASIGINGDPPDQQASILKVEMLLAERELELHPHIKWFWESWPRDGTELVHPRFTGPALAASMMKSNDELPFLVPIGYGSATDLLVDVIPSDFGPGIYVNDCYDDHGIQLIFAGFADMLRYLIAFFDDIRDDPIAGPGVESPFEFVYSRSRLVSLLPPNISDDERRPVTDEVNTWPQRWRKNRNLGEDVAALRGATHTVAELISARQRGPVQATMVGKVSTLGASSAGTQVRLTDQTGSVELRILPEAPNLGESPTHTYELDVIADQQNGPERSIDEFSGDHAEVSRLAESGFFIDALEAGREMSLRGLGEHITGRAPIRAFAIRPIG